MADEENKEAKEVPKKDKSGLFMLLFMVLNLSAVGGGAFLVYSSTLGYKAPVINEYTEEAKLEEMRQYMEDNPVLFTMEPFTVNLRGKPRRTIRLEMSVEMLSEQGFEELIRIGGKARDEVVEILNTKNFDDLESIQGKLFLKDQIARRINTYLDAGVVKDVYFSDFVVQ
ncbi:MAG: flagellar basal body-associated protein FliL [Bdellovibrionales bacterium]